MVADRRVGLKIREFRKEAGLTQAELAEASSLETESINRIENAKLNVARSTLQRIATALGCAVSDLLSHQRAIRVAPPRLSPARRRLLRLTDELTEAQVEVLVRSLDSILRLVAEKPDRSAAAANGTGSRKKGPAK